MHVGFLVLFLTVIVLYFYGVCGDLQSDIDVQLRKRNSTSLLRKRRYLVFPEGSSFQVVYDLAYPSIDGIGFFVYGNTAAMAWELPSTPVFLDKKFQKQIEPEDPTTMLPQLEHHDDYNYDWQPHETWEPNHKIDYGWQSTAGVRHNARLGYESRRPVSSYSNPFHSYANRGYNSDFISNKQPLQYAAKTYSSGYSHKSNPKDFWNRRTFYKQRNRPTMKQSYQLRNENLDKQFHNKVHRRTRRELFAKLEEVFSMLMNDGKTCVLKIICQVHQTPKEKGSFFEELLKTVFKVKPDDAHVNEDHYDQAANAEHDCDNMYPKCKGNALDQLISSVISNNKNSTH